MVPIGVTGSAANDDNTCVVECCLYCQYAWQVVLPTDSVLGQVMLPMVRIGVAGSAANSVNTRDK